MAEIVLWSVQTSGDIGSLNFRPQREICCLENAGIVSCFKIKCLQSIQLNSDVQQTDLKQYTAVRVSCCVLATMFQTFTWKKQTCRHQIFHQTTILYQVLSVIKMYSAFQCIQHNSCSLASSCCSTLPAHSSPTPLKNGSLGFLSYISKFLHNFFLQLPSRQTMTGPK